MTLAGGVNVGSGGNSGAYCGPNIDTARTPDLKLVYNMVSSWRGGPRAPSNPWRALTLEWQVSSPPPIFNFDNVPTVVGGPYEYGVPGAVHGIFKPAEEARPKQPAGAPASAEEEA